MCQAGTISLLKTELFFRSEKIFRKGNSFIYKELQEQLYLGFSKKMDFFTENLL